MAVSHAKSQTGAAWTGTVTVFNSQGSTATIAATDLVRPGDWNSAHNFYQTISGNTAGSSTASGTNLVIGGSNNITASLSTAAGAATLWMSGPNLTQYLTTARASNDAVGLNTAATNVTWTVGSAGISLNAGAYLTTAQPPGAYLTTARASNDAIGLNSALTANGVSMTANSSGLSLNFPAFLTTAAQSGHSHGNPSLALTNISGTTASNSAGLTLSLSAAAPGGGAAQTFSAGGTSFAPNPVYFSNANGVSFGLGAGASTSVVTASHNALTTARASNDAVGLNTAATQVTWTVNSSGISLNAGAYLTTARASNDAIGLNTALTANGVSWTVNSSGLSLNVPAFLTTAANSTHSHGNPTLALTNLSGTTASASNGLTLSLSAAAGGGGTVSYYATNNTTQTSSGTYANSLVVSGAGILSAGMTGNTLILSVPAGGGAGDGYNIIQGSGNTAGTMNTYASATFVLAGGPSITLSQSSNTMSINAPAQSVLTYAGGVSLSSNGSTITVSGIPVAVSAGTQASSTFQTLSLANSNGLSWSTGTQGLYGSHNGLTTAAQSDHSHGNPTLALTNLSGTTASASNGLTLSLSAAAPGGGAGFTYSNYPLQVIPHYSSSCVSGTSGGTGGSTQHTLTGYLCPFMLEAAVSYGDFEMLVSNATVAGTGSMSFGHMVGVYTLNGGSAFSLERSYQWAGIFSQNSQTAITWQTWWGTNSTSNSGGFNGNSTASVTGVRQIILNTSPTSFSAGQYYLMHMYTARSSSSLLGQPASAFYHIPAAGSGSTYWTGGARIGQSTTQQPWGQGWAMGLVSTTTNNSNTGMPCLPASVHTSCVTGTGGSSRWRMLVPWMYL